MASSFSAGSVDLTGIDTEEEDVIDQTSSLAGVPREPDGVVFVNNNYFVTADEGDMDGGSRGFTVWDVCGNDVYGSGNFIDQYAASIGHYPESRSGNKGAEPENVAFGRFMGTDFLFVNAERANLSMVYDVSDPTKPKFRQVLPTNIGPEGGLTIPDRNLYVVANEVDIRGMVRAGLTIYEYAKQSAQYPTLISVKDPEVRSFMYRSFQRIESVNRSCSVSNFDNRLELLFHLEHFLDFLLIQTMTMYFTR